MYRNGIKRALAVVLSLAGMVCLSPLLLALCIAIKLDSPGPVLFKQKRVGIHKKHFDILKFRTMADTRDAKGNLLPDAERLTGFGRFLRSTSLDELPELFNVLKGEMSLVGPRPLLMAYLPLYTPEQARRHEVRPGITGWAQVNGRNAISWEEKFRFDVWYVDNQSFWLDLKILLLTVKKVVVRDGISAVGEATAPRFTGSPERGD